MSSSLSTIEVISDVPEAHKFDENALCEYMRQNVRTFPKAPQQFQVKKFSHGQSNPTFLIICDGKRFVMRKKPPGKLLHSAHQVEREYRVMNALRGTDVPVPECFCLCTDSSVVGTPFFVMEFLEGRVFTDPKLTDLRPYDRYAIYSELNRVMAAMHTVDFEEIGLGDFGRKSEYVARQVRRWTKQFIASKTKEEPNMDKLIKYLNDNMEEVLKEDQTAIVHGDFRLDNCIFHPTENRILGVVDWELSTLGHPMSDVFYICMAYYQPAALTGSGLMGLNLAETGIPSEREWLRAYARNANCLVRPEKHRKYYLALSFFRLASIVQGVHKRRLDGNASQKEPAKGRIDYALICNMLATIGINIVNKSAESNYQDEPLPDNLLSFKEHFSPNFYKYRAKLLAFMDEVIYPAETVYAKQRAEQKDRWQAAPVMEEIKIKAKERGLWNLWLPESKNGVGLTNLEYAPLCEIMGRSAIGPEAMNCSAPDTGNMEVLERYGNEEMKERWLKLLLDGEIRSAFAMTERRVASSDASNIESRIERDGDHYIINGRKWWTSGTPDPRCKVMIFMGKTDPTAERHKQQSMIVVPLDTPGVRVLRHLTVYGYDDAPHGHGEVDFKDVRVPLNHMLLGEGRGFEIAQGRLGPGRIHHCMRSIGKAERALEIMCRRVLNRYVFKTQMAKKDTILADIANSRMEIEQARLLVLHTAQMMDTHGNQKVLTRISMIKVAVIEVLNKVLDRAIQAHGGMGVCQDTMLPKMWTSARTLRLADGPDEVHRMRIGKAELRQSKL